MTHWDVSCSELAPACSGLVPFAFSFCLTGPVLFLAEIGTSLALAAPLGMSYSMLALGQPGLHWDLQGILHVFFKSRPTGVGFPPAAGLWGGKSRKGVFDPWDCLHLVAQGW